MIVFIFGYFFMAVIFLISRLFYHLLKKNFLHEIKKDFFNLLDYIKQIISENPKKFKIIGGLIVIFFVATTVQIKNLIMFDDFVATIIFLLMVIIFSPKENSPKNKFPVEIFGFIYSLIFMYCSAGDFVVEIFWKNNIQDMWIFGYCIVLITYLICIATLSRFMEHDLSKIEIIFVGMIMMTTLEFMTYYGIGFSCGIEFISDEMFENNILKVIADIINRGIFIASQSEILERETKEILGYIILNGTDALTITAVLGYVLQKFIEKN